MYTRIWIVAALVGLAGCSKDRAPDGTALEASAHECPEGATCEVNGDVVVETYMTATGLTEQIVTVTYGELPNGNRTVQRATDSGGNGTTDKIVGEAFDSNGSLLIWESDHDADGTVDSRCTWTYDDDGNRLTKAWDWGADGTVDERGTFTYDDDGNRLAQDWDRDADGTVDSRSTFTYDDDGNRLGQDWDRDADGTVDERYTWTYDAAGNRLTQRNRDGDGTVDSRCTYDPPCPPEVHRNPDRMCSACVNVN
jgi:YD repeat-containing protein